MDGEQRRRERAAARGGLTQQDLVFLLGVPATQIVRWQRAGWLIGWRPAGHSGRGVAWLYTAEAIRAFAVEYPQAINPARIRAWAWFVRTLAICERNGSEGETAA